MLSSGHVVSVEETIVVTYFLDTVGMNVAGASPAPRAEATNCTVGFKPMDPAR